MQDAMSMPTVKMESVCVMEVITELGLWENVSVWEVCGNGDQRSTISSYLSLQIENVQYITCSDTVAHITK